MAAACRGGCVYTVTLGPRLEWSQQLETLVITVKIITYKICVH